jgi:hypothetical protein
MEVTEMDATEVVSPVKVVGPEETEVAPEVTTSASEAIAAPAASNGVQVS